MSVARQHSHLESIGLVRSIDRLAVVRPADERRRRHETSVVFALDAQRFVQENVESETKNVRDYDAHEQASERGNVFVRLSFRRSPTT